MQRKLVFLACFLICVNCFSQQYPFVYYTPKDGLVNSRVRSIKQDSKGRMHFLTYGGLSIYDGTRFINYHQPDGLANELVNDIVEITPDSFLIATNTQKLNTLVHGKIGTYQTSDGFCPVINRFLKSSDGYWYAAADEGLFILKDKKFTRLPFTKNGKDMGSCLDKIIEWKNFFFIIPWNTELEPKLILYNRHEKYVADVVLKEKIFSTRIDANGTIRFVTSNGFKHAGLAQLEQGKIVLKKASYQYDVIKKENANVFFDASGNVWFYGGNHVQKITPQFYEQILSVEQGLKTRSITDIFQDREGIIWLASDGNGVIKMKSANIQLLNTILPGHQMAFSAIMQKQDTIWLFNSTGNSVYRVIENKVKRFPVKPKINAFNLHVIGNRLYLANDKEIFFVENKDNVSAYTHLKRVVKDADFFLGNSITDRNGTIIQYGKKGDSLYLLRVIRNHKTLMNYKIGYAVDQMTIDQKGRLWIATRNNHIMVFGIQPEHPASYLILLKDFSKELPDVSPRSITVDRQNNLWIGTRYNGLYHFWLNDLQILRNDQYTTKNGLTDNFISTLACDSANTVWVGTQTGLDKIFMSKGSYVIGNISKNNNIFLTVTKIQITKSGTVWALNNDGTILKIIPSAATLPLQQPSFLLTSIKVNDQVFNEGVTSFSYKQNNFSFTVAAPSFADERSIKYSYFLEGSGNTNWSEPSNMASFNFINLSAGSYTLNMRASFPEAIYPQQMLRYSFIIRQPWWQTWWFKLGIALAVLGLLTFIVRMYYIRKLQRQKMILESKQAIEKERTRIATDMHDDLGAGLSRIKFLSETIGIKKQQHQPIEEDITKIREYSHQMIDKMGEIVWALNERNDSLNDLIAYTRAYAMEYLSQNGIECKVEMPSCSETFFVSGEFRRNIFLSVKEILHNIVKHAHADHVVISVEVNHHLSINISDDGRGFDRSKIRPFSNGLMNIEKRIKEIGGSVEIKNVNGTAIRLFVPLA